jgi:uncharacterized integral membrane protein
MRGALWIALVLAVLLATAFFVSANRQEVTLRLFVVDVPTTAWMLALGAFLLGAALTGLVASLALLRLRFRLRGQRRELGRLEQEVHGLRTLPLAPEESGTRAREG